jgi:hypothetical protein
MPTVRQIYKKIISLWALRPWLTFRFFIHESSALGHHRLTRRHQAENIRAAHVDCLAEGGSTTVLVATLMVRRHVCITDLISRGKGRTT